MAHMKRPQSFSSEVESESITMALQSRQRAGDKECLLSQFWSYLGPEEPSSEGSHTSISTSSPKASCFLTGILFLPPFMVGEGHTV